MKREAPHLYSRLFFLWVIFLAIGSLPLAAQAAQLESEEFHVLRVDGKVAYRAELAFRSPLSPEVLADHLHGSNLSPSPANPRLAHAYQISGSLENMLIYQKYEVRVLVFSDSTEMIIHYFREFLDPGIRLSWKLEGSPDGKMHDIEGSWQILPAPGGGSTLRYQILTVFARSDGFFETVLRTFGLGEVRAGLHQLFRALKP